VIKLSQRILGAAALLMAGCGRAGEATHVDQTSSDTVMIAPADTPSVNSVPPPTAQAPATAQVPLPPPSLTCSPDNFGPNDTLSLHMSVPHGDWLIATQPGDSLFYVIFPQRNARQYSLIPPEEFKQMETLKLASNVKAVPWYFGRDTILAPLFPRPGKYVLTMGENLAGDNARGASCTVTFTQQDSR
jgi:hypothetical protein